jgi:hypothetical protein
VGRYSRLAKHLKRIKQTLALQGQSWADRPEVAIPVPVRVSQRLDAATIQQLVSDYEAGLSGRQVAVKYDLARSTVLGLVRTHGVAVRYPRLTPAECAEIAALYQDGVAQVDIARQFKRDPGVVWHVLERSKLVGERD